MAKAGIKVLHLFRTIMEKQHGLSDNDKLLSDSLFSMYVFPHQFTLCKLVLQSDLSVSRQQEQSSWWVVVVAQVFGTGSGCELWWRKLSSSQHWVFFFPWGSFVTWHQKRHIQCDSYKGLLPYFWQWVPAGCQKYSKILVCFYFTLSDHSRIFG